MRIEEITDEHLAECWPVIGGAPHLFEYGKEDLKALLTTGFCDEGSIQMDFWTMKCLVKKLTELGYEE